MQEQDNLRRNSRLLLIVVALLVVWWLAVQVSHIGKVRVTVNVLPHDSQLLIDGKRSKAGTKYLGKGRHELVAKKSGFTDASQTVTLTGKSTIVNLLPTPSSDEAIQWLNDHPSVQYEREAIGSQSLNQETQAVVAQTPLIKLLPVTSLEGPYSIDYGPSTTVPHGSVIIISDSTPNGRQAALKWIRQQGFDPTDLEIKYDDFVNPLTDSGALR